MTEIIEAFWRSEARLVVQAASFLIIIGGLIHVHIRLGAVIRQLTDERADAIIKVQRVADGLAARVTMIAEKVMVDVNQQQQVVQKVVDVASAVLHHELATKTDNGATVREQIDAIKQSTEEIARTVNGAAPKVP